jgi:release factor glutamine methyltransferase
VLRQAHDLPAELRICDLGTGSGAIAVALLSELPRTSAVATDISEAALRVAGENAERHGVRSRLTLLAADFGKAPDGPFDVVVSNPPYVKRDAIAGLQREVRDHDPRLALDGGRDGLDDYRAILARIGRLLAPRGLLALEVGFDQAALVASLCREAGLVAIDSLNDLGGYERVVTARGTGFEVTSRATKKALGEIG